MFTRERFERYRDHVKHFSENRLRETGKLPPQIGVWRDDVPYAFIVPGPPDPSQGDEYGRDPILRAAWACIVGMEPDEITMAVDSYMVTQMTKSDGTEWGPGEMQYAREHNTVDAQYVFDTVMLTAMDRTGSAAFANMPYKVEESAFGRFKVVWLDLDERDRQVYIEGDEETPGRLEGYMNDVLREAFAKPRLKDSLLALGDSEMEEEARARAMEHLGSVASDEEREQLGQMTAADAVAYMKEFPRQAFAHQMCAVIKAFLLPQGCEIAIAIEDEEILGIFMSSLKRAPGVFGPEDLS